MANAWDSAAPVRRKQIEEGLDITFNHVFLPHYVNLVKDLQPRRMLEIGCGTGHLSLKLSESVAEIVALEPSHGMHSIATEVLAGNSVKLHNDSAEHFSSRRRFDLILSHLCGHVVENIDNFFYVASRFLANDGRFVFSLPHPCFWNQYKNIIQQAEYRYNEERMVETSLTITMDTINPIKGVPYHHRPLSRYFGSLSAAGMHVTRFEEILPSADIQSLYGSKWEFPRYCVFHARRS